MSSWTFRVLKSLNQSPGLYGAAVVAVATFFAAQSGQMSLLLFVLLLLSATLIGAVAQPAGAIVGVVVFVVTWLRLTPVARRRANVSVLLLFVLLLAAGVGFPGRMEEVVLFVVMAVVSTLIFLAPLLWRRAPTSVDQTVRFRNSIGLWLSAYLVALFWFGDPGDFAL